MYIYMYIPGYYVCPSSYFTYLLLITYAVCPFTYITYIYILRIMCALFRTLHILLVIPSEFLGDVDVWLAFRHVEPLSS